MNTTTTLKRVQLDLTERAFLRLQALRAKTEASSNAEVIKNALRLYEAVIDEVNVGGSFLVKEKDGALKQYVIF